MSKLALLFPGQGAQALGMGQDLAEAYPQAYQVFAQADQALGFAISNIITHGPLEQLNLTPFTQPAILATSLAYWRAWQAAGVQATAAIGLSLGEYSALVAANAIDFSAAVRLVHERGKAMDESYPAGAGAVSVVLGLDREIVRAICQEVANEASWVQASNFNCPGQVVIAGDRAAVLAATARLEAAGAKRIIPLSVSAPFHTRLLAEAGRRFEPHLRSVSWRIPEMTVVSNVDASVYLSEDQLLQLLGRQVSEPIEFEQGVVKLLSLGFTHFLEIAPGGAMGGMVKKISRQAIVYQATTAAQIADVSAKIQNEMGADALE